MQHSSISERLHGLDALRAGALLLGILLHATMSFLPGASYFWVVSDKQYSVFLGPVFFFIHVFRMPLFFMLAGFFAHLAVEKKGVRAFLHNRLRRIAVPLLIAWPLIFSAIVAAIIYAAWVRNGGSFPKNSPPPPHFTPDRFPLAHLWFLYMLLLLYAVTLAIRAGVGLTGISKHLIQISDRLMAILTAWPGPVLLALPVALALFYTPYWINWFGVPTPDQSLYPGLAAWISFGMAFGLGWMLQQYPAAFSNWQRQWPWHMTLGLSLVACCLLLTGVTPQLVPAAHNANKLIYAWLYVCAAWSLCFGLTGVALKFMHKARPVIRYLADASYWIYLIHLPLVMALQVAVSRNDWHWAIKLATVLLMTMMIALLSYHWGVRNTFIGATLNGKRQSVKAGH
ncbi:acyltransferase family protein [Undibacterium sp. TJN19]|uniref:acyltransferase family protein n=1 Tax=Undibacterium sp. TJN19 TaxID=3413055 RepID=UPI003BF3280B